MVLIQLHRFKKKIQNVSYWPFDLFSIKNGVTEFVFEIYEQIKRKYRVFLAGLSRYQGNLLRHNERIGVSYGTITLLFHVVASIVLKRVSF